MVATFVVIGAGSIGTRHAGNLKALGEAVELIPYRDFDADSFAARDDVAGVVIATATPIRLDLIKLCAQQGWPLYAEKPLAWTAAQVEAIYQAAAPIADRSVVGFMMRYHPVLRALAQRDLSDIYDFSFQIGHDVRQWRANWSFTDSYASSPEGGGVLLDLCHELDMAHSLFPQAKVTSANSLDHPDFAGVDFATQVQLAEPLGCVRMDYLSPVSTRRARLSGTAQCIDVDLLGPSLEVAGESPTHFDFDRNDMFLGLMADFVALAKGQAPSDNPLLPRFDSVRGSCDLIAKAWESRAFVGKVTLDL